MKTIKLRYLARGKRTMVVDMHGFEGPAVQPLKGILQDGGEYLKKGEITALFTLLIPVSGECEVVDTQYNRVRLRKATKPYMVPEEVEVQDKQTGKYSKVRKEIEIPAAFEVLDGTDVFEDLEVLGEERFSKSQVDAMIKEAIAAKKKGGAPAKVKAKTGPTNKGVIAKENLKPIVPSSDRFAGKVMPTNATPITGKGAPNLEPAEA